MKLIVSFPHAAADQESKLIMLFARYLQGFRSTIDLLQCDGAVSTCQRDKTKEWKRTFANCFSCMSESKKMAEWLNLNPIQISNLLSPETVKTTASWLNSISNSALERVEFNSIRLVALCVGSMISRFGTAEVDYSNSEHLSFLRNLMLNSIRVQSAVDKIVQENKPNLVLLAGGQDYLSGSIRHAFTQAGVAVGVFRMASNLTSVNIIHPRCSELMSCDIQIDNLDEFRGNPSEWPQEILSNLGELAGFLDLSANQLSLPIAR